MSEFGGPESFAPGEGVAGAAEQLSEQAKERFAAAAAAMQAIRREEKRSKKRDDQVAKTIIQFLGNDEYAHLFILISRLVARDCPSIFILSILSLIDEGSMTVVQDYLKETVQKTAKEAVEENVSLMKAGTLDAETNRALLEWITRMQMVLSLEPEKILLSLMIDDRNLDGTVLQLASFVLQDFFGKQQKSAAFEKIQPLAASILTTVFEPFIGGVRKILLDRAKEVKVKDDE